MEQMSQILTSAGTNDELEGACHGDGSESKRVM